jgi:hypothetical protein
MVLPQTFARHVSFQGRTCQVAAPNQTSAAGMTAHRCAHSLTVHLAWNRPDLRLNSAVCVYQQMHAVAGPGDVLIFR